MNVQLYGYVRVSTREQNEDRQVIAMREFGIPEENIIVEMMSGKNFQRPAYQKMVNRLKPGDVLVIDSLDRLGRDRDAVVEEWRRITKEQRADIVVLDMLPLLDTKKKRLRHDSLVRGRPGFANFGLCIGKGTRPQSPTSVCGHCRRKTTRR